MPAVITRETLRRENAAFRGTGGRSEENRSLGFRPAFRDEETYIVYASRFADGREAMCHLIDGLPDEIVIARHATGRVAAIKVSVISGFLLNGQFYTRAEAAACAARELAEEEI